MVKFYLENFTLENNMCLSRVTTLLPVILVTAIFISIWTWTRDIVSISIISIIIIFLISNRKTNLGNVKIFLKRNSSFILLIFAGLLYSVNCIYLSIINQDTYTIKLLFNLANPLILTLYTFALVYLLSKNKNYPKFLINVFYIIVSFVATLSFLFFIFYWLKGQTFLISNFYSKPDHIAQSQNIVALTFPFAAILLLNKIPDINKILCKMLIVVLALIIIFADIFINRSKIGYLIELIVLIYYSFYIIKKYSYINKKFHIKKLLIVSCLVIFSLSTGLYIAYKTSGTFHQRISTGMYGFNKFFNKDSNKNIERSVEIRLIYYTNSLKIFKEYPKILLFGCPLNEGTINSSICTKKIINKSPLIQESMKGLKDIPPHNEFINYTYQSGALASLSLFLFLILLYRESKNTYKEYIMPMRILVIAFFIGCNFDFFMTRQFNTTIFFTLLGIFLSLNKPYIKGCQI